MLKPLGICNRKLNAAAAGTRSGWCFQSQNHFLPTFGALLRAKTAKLFLVGQCISQLSARSTATHADRCLPTRARNGSPSASGRAAQGGTYWNNGRRGWFSSYEGGYMTRVTPPCVGMNLVTQDFEFAISTATRVTPPHATQKSMSASTHAHQLCAVSPSRCTPQIRNNYS